MYSIKIDFDTRMAFQVAKLAQNELCSVSSIYPFSLAMHDLLQQCTHAWDNIKPHLKSKGM